MKLKWVWSYERPFLAATADRYLETQLVAHLWCDKRRYDTLNVVPILQCEIGGAEPRDPSCKRKTNTRNQLSRPQRSEPEPRAVACKRPRDPRPVPRCERQSARPEGDWVIGRPETGARVKRCPKLPLPTRAAPWFRLAPLGGPRRPESVLRGRNQPAEKTGWRQ
jgi:hypothetical protein